MSEGVDRLDKDLTIGHMQGNGEVMHVTSIQHVLSWSGIGIVTVT